MHNFTKFGQYFKGVKQGKGLGKVR